MDRPHLVGWIILLSLTIFCSLAIDILGFILPTIADPFYGGDFTVFWHAARAPAHVIYDPVALTQAQSWITGPTYPRPFAYPPTFLFLVEPFSWLPHWPALVAWNVVGLSVFILAGRMMARGAAMLLALISPPVVTCLITGQSTLVVAGLIMAAILSLDKRPVIAGLIFGLVACLKPQAVLLVPVALIVAGLWRTIVAACFAGVLFGLFSVVIHGWQLWAEWIDAVTGFLTVVDAAGLIDKGITPTALAASLGLKGLAASGLVIVGAMLGLATVFLVFRSASTSASKLTAIVTGSIFCSPYAMPYELSMMVPVAAAMLLEKRAHPFSWLAAASSITTLGGAYTLILIAVDLILRHLNLIRNVEGAQVQQGGARLSQIGTLQAGVR